jgi:hypothetical protein
MKRFIILLCIGCVVFCSSCARRHKCLSHLRIKTVYNALSGYTSTYYYNEEQNLVAVVQSNGSRTNIEYAPQSVSGKTIGKDGGVSSSWFCFLNRRGLVDSMIKRDSAQITSTKKYLYDNQAFATEEREYVPGMPVTITRKTVNGGNVVSFTVMHAGDYPARITYNPSTGKRDTVSITATGKDYTVYSDYVPGKEKTMAFGNYGSPEFGEGTKNIENRTVQISSEGDTIDASYYKYDFDKDGRVIKCVTRNQAGELVDSSYISYY